MAEKEQVLVVPREKLFVDGETPRGFGTERLDDYLTRIRRSAYFHDRAEVEENPGLKQIIPYMLVTDGERVFLLKRLEKQTEKRLRNLYSIGVGGHINPVDENAGDVVEAGLRRELAEELSLLAEPVITPLGYLNDDSNPVGSVHFGLVFRVAAPAHTVDVAERDMMEGRFLDLKEMEGYVSGMETWSQLLFEYIRSKPESVLEAAV